MSSQMKLQPNSPPLQVWEQKCQKHPYYHLLYISSVQCSSDSVFKCLKCKSEEQLSDKDLIPIAEFSKDLSTSNEEIQSSLKWIFKGDEELLKQVSQLQHYQIHPKDYQLSIRSFFASAFVQLLQLIDQLQSKFEAQSKKLYDSGQNNLSYLKQYVSTTNAKLREALRDSQASEKVRVLFDQLTNNEREKIEQIQKNIKESIEQKTTLEKELPKIIQDEIAIKLKELEKVIDGNIQNLEFKVNQIGQQCLSDFNMNFGKKQDEKLDSKIPQNIVKRSNQEIIMPSGEINNQSTQNIQSQPINEQYSQILQFIHSKYSRENTPFFQSPITVDQILTQEYRHNQKSFEQVKALFKEQNIFNVSILRGDGNCFFRSFFTSYLLSKIASMKDPAQEVPQFLNDLQQIPILYPTQAEEVFGKDFEVSLLVNASLSYFLEQISTLAQRENRLKYLFDLFNNSAFDFAMQILCKSLIVQAANQVIQKKIDPLYYYIDYQLILASVKPLNSENGSTEIFSLLATYLNTELVVVSCKKDDTKQKEIFSPTQGLPDSLLMLPLNAQGKPQQLALWFKVGHYYLAFPQEQLIIMRNLKNQI